jgi:hypothetical protein
VGVLAQSGDGGAEHGHQADDSQLFHGSISLR